MTGRKPPGTDWETWIDALIREGRDRGEFENLAGAGKPIDGLDKPHDELWWLRKKLKDEGLSYLPPTLAIRKDKEDTLEAIETIRSETRVREVLEKLNERIRAVNRQPAHGPPSTVMPVGIDDVVVGWRARHPPVSTRAGSSAERRDLTVANGRPDRQGWLGRQRRHRGE